MGWLEIVTQKDKGMGVMWTSWQQPQNFLFFFYFGVKYSHTLSKSPTISATAMDWSQVVYVEWRCWPTELPIASTTVHAEQEMK